MNKNNILDRVSPKTIYLHFLDLPDFPIKNIKSPFAEDEHPSFKLYENGTFKCFSSGKQGDVFQFVADLKGLDSKTQFPEIKQIITSELKIENNTHPIHLKTVTVPQKTDTISLQHHSEWLPIHLAYWAKYGVSAQILDEYHVKPLKYFEFIDSKSALKKFPIYDGVAAFSYELNGRIEIYVPQQEKNKKFYLSKHTNADVFGLSQLKKGQPVIICAGKKDCLTLITNGFQAVSFKSEATNPTREQIDILRHYGQLYICYDNDYQNAVNNGQQRQLEIAKKHNLLQIQLPADINDVADLYVSSPATFKTYIQQQLNTTQITPIKEQKEENSEEQLTTILHVAENYLSKHYEIHRNTIKLDIEIRPKNSNAPWKCLNEDTLWNEMFKKGINISMERLLSVLRSDFTPEFNPFHDYFNNLPKWDGKDYINELANYVVADNQDRFNHHFKKWLVRAIKCALIPTYFNKQAFVLVHSTQGSGKTTFCRFLCPPSLQGYFAEDLKTDKDSRIKLCKNFLINLDELAELNRQEINALKSYFSKTQINERLPYDRKNSIISRTCSFIGSTNESEFLNDETGSVRWLLFNIQSIKWNYDQKVNIDNVWSQALALSNDPSFKAEMTRDEIEENERRNKEFQVITNERALIQSFLAHPSDSNPGVFATSTDILIYLQLWSTLNKLSSVLVGKAMKSEGYAKIKKYNEHKVQQSGYMIVKLKG